MPYSPRPDDSRTMELLIYENVRGTLYVQGDDLPWILRYVYEEMQGARVPEPPDDGDDMEDDESREFGTKTRWSPTGTWSCEVKRGVLQGHQLFAGFRT